MKILTLSAILLACTVCLRAQETANSATAVSAPTSNLWEAGLHAGHFFTAGNVDFIPGYAGGIHVRRALDYVFSLRFDLLYGSARGEDAQNARNFSNKWMSGSMLAVASLNQLKWTTGERKTNFYGLLGIGLNSFTVDFEHNPEGAGTVDADLGFHSEMGAGIAFRINPRVNFGVEHKAMIVFGERSDLPDGFRTETLTEDQRGTFRDVLQYTNLRLNFNFGKTASDKVEPLYWLNPMEGVVAELTRLKELEASLADQDQDGVIDRVDKDKNTLPNVLVNSRGQTLDSDGDGIADYLDREPFSPTGYPIDAFGVAKQPNSEGEIAKLIDKKMEQAKAEIVAQVAAQIPAQGQGAGSVIVSSTQPSSKPATEPATSQPATIPAPPTPSVGGATAAASFHPSVLNLSMPTVYFGFNSSKIEGTDYILLQKIAHLMRDHADLRLLVMGHSDKPGEESYNQVLSFNRATAVVDYLVKAYKIPRERFVLQYKGSAEAFVAGEHEANRRVQFLVAKGDEQNMAAPKK